MKTFCVALFLLLALAPMPFSKDLGYLSYKGYTRWQGFQQTGGLAVKTIVRRRFPVHTSFLQPIVLVLSTNNSPTPPEDQPSPLRPSTSSETFGTNLLCSLLRGKLPALDSNDCYLEKIS